MNGFWEAAAGHRLTTQRCRTCGHRQHHPRELCIACGGADLEFAEVSGRGTVDSFTDVHRSPAGEPVPYTVARVRLAEGPVLLTRLEGPGPWRCDQPVAVRWLELPDGRTMPVFEAEEP